MLGQTGLGYSFDDFTNSKADELGDCIKRFFPVLVQNTAMLLVCSELEPWFSHSTIRALFCLVPHKGIRYFMYISDTMTKRAREIIVRANIAAADNEKLTHEELVAQISTFMLAGMDTTSNALARVFQLLAEHPEAQAKLRAEVAEAQGNDRADLSYEVLERLPYLDAVCRETLLFAPVPASSRTTYDSATKDTVLPFMEPIRLRDGTEVSELFVERGTTVTPLFFATNIDRALWGPDANEWKPERWLRAIPKPVEDARIPGVYAHLTTFSAGTHSCIGFKSSQLEMKVIISLLITRYQFDVTRKPVAWNFAPVIHPTMGEESERPELLLNVTATED
ncbi:cytochrome P450 [Epithele typhae]|uniref:cytochrome P450 n=1 Tax=Epithele typhae TaxID=378194 RepID=UPI002007D747|nr:cytochrome P450 [Epithele typhae]KAH9925031.1 cytochrome P450 [Epithele typhae]